ncbi:MAG: hypothetical protein KatS3mg105_3594 [Gemmatales bacterium]|nr:MAG: hypothetical protein KatS3mg105_3594 [Gemmatales bacterium]
MSNTDDELVRLMTVPNPATGHIIEQALQAEGIEAKVVGDYLDASFGDLPGTLPEIWVHQKDLEAAKKIVEQHTSSSDQDSDEG